MNDKELQTAYLLYYQRYYKLGEGERANKRVRQFLDDHGVKSAVGLSKEGRKALMELFKGE